MGWTIDPSVGRRIRACASTAETMRVDTCVHRVAMPPREFRAFLTDTLAIGSDDVGDADAVAARLSGACGRPVLPPESIARANAWEASAASVALARSMGVDPLRLAMCAFDARGRMTDGPLSVEVEVRRALGREADRGVGDQLSVKIGLSHGVTWMGRRMSVRGSTLPKAVLHQLPGRSMRSVTDHPWDGWDGIRVVRAEQRGNTVTIETDATAGVDVFEGL